jgi:hypothetical protein
MVLLPQLAELVGLSLAKLLKAAQIWVKRGYLLALAAQTMQRH